MLGHMVKPQIGEDGVTKTKQKTFKSRVRHSGLQSARRPTPKQFYHTIADGSHNWEYMIGADGSFLYVSPSCERISGYTAREFMEDPDLYIKIIHPDDRDKVLKHLNCMHAGPVHAPMDFRIISQKGEVHWISHVCSPIFDDQGEFIGRRGSNQDATEKVNLERRLFHSEFLFRTIFEGIGTGIAVYTASENGRDFIFKEINKAGEESSRLKREHIIGKSVQEVFPSVEKLGLLEVFRRVYRTGEPEHKPMFQYSDHRVDLWVENYVYKLPSGEIAAIFEDKTAEKAVQEELRISRERMQLAIDSVSDAFWDWCIPEKRAYFSPRYYTMLGYEPDEMEPSMETWEMLMHPDDFPRAKRLMIKYLKSGEPYSVEFRMKTKGGDWKWILGRGRVMEFDENGRAQRMVGTHVDIHQKKQFENRLELAQKVFDEALEGVVVTDQDGKILSTNKAFSNITGYSAGEALGENPSILKSDRQDDDFYKKMWDALIEKGEWRGEIWNRRKNGEAYPQWTTITAVKDDFGVASRYVGVFHDLSDVRRGEEMLRHQAYHDALTDLPNRELFTEHLRQAIARAERADELLAVIVLDLDDFVSVNNALGHVAGDKILQEAADRLVLRHGWREFCCRMGADDFVLVQTGLKSPSDAALTADSLNTIFDEPFRINDEEIYLSASMGIAVTKKGSEPADPITLIKNADVACREAKQSGQGKHRFFKRSMNEEANKRLAMLGSLRTALQNNEITVHYQPKVITAHKTIMGMEALVRWRRNGGLASPADFIPLAEDTGLIVPIGRFVLEESCRQTQHWRTASGKDVKVAVNVSPRQFREDDMPLLVREVLDKTGLPPGALELEITESVLMQNPEQSRITLQDLRAMGVTTSLDDFGAGYSSLSYLRRFPIDVLKIDKSFVDDVPDERQANMLVRAIVEMAHGLNIQVVAEGVETKDQLDFLHKIETDYIQGYYFSKPLPPEEFEALLHEGPLVQPFAPYLC
ncbi:PAS domain S-box-containing protein/diguanylate cyclase (GGDEF) domain-containing protein [Desulfatibacillum alkenivorans DSM 16219]|uniref:PAS domain S-box-containing protein/diguanylate cyclase (GGDEF) domain-containing protein n=2 Tax=Desulfatibacillum alkenivorans TaxID=259354 RepID=A0A1M6I410_9BACT|nr:PAS domain S-box-containing protein/diguanylate cyclase (GGDEF) domain-containing protein [Desulfatibacillum alkenivorans DSM 16219]